MAITRWDEPKALESEKKSARLAQKKQEGEDTVADVETQPPKNPYLKTPLKRKREEKKEEENSGEKRLEYLKERAKKAIIPTEQVATLKPEHIFLESGPLIVHLCYECKKFNSTRPTATVGTGMVQLPLAMCTVCRSHFNHQRTIRFFEHELPAVKKTFNL